MHDLKTLHMFKCKCTVIFQCKIPEIDPDLFRKHIYYLSWVALSLDKIMN